MNKDFRVRVQVLFSVDVGAGDKADAADAARVITQSVFKNAYDRADDADIDIVEVEEI